MNRRPTNKSRPRYNPAGNDYHVVVALSEKDKLLLQKLGHGSINIGFNQILHQYRFGPRAEYQEK